MRLEQFSIADKPTLDSVDEKIGKSTDTANAGGTTGFSLLKFLTGTWTAAKAAFLDVSVSSRADSADVGTRANAAVTTVNTTNTMIAMQKGTLNQVNSLVSAGTGTDAFTVEVNGVAKGTWVRVPDVATNTISCFLGGYLYYFYSSLAFIKRDVLTGAYITMPMPNDIGSPSVDAFCAADVVGNKIYLMGYGGVPEKVWVYDVLSETWSSPGTSATAFCASTTLSKSPMVIYHSGSLYKATVAVSNNEGVARLNLSTMTVTGAARGITGASVTATSLCGQGNYVYVFGGSSALGLGRYDINANTYTSAPASGATGSLQSAVAALDTSTNLIHLVYPGYHKVYNPTLSSPVFTIQEGGYMGSTLNAKASAGIYNGVLSVIDSVNSSIHNYGITETVQRILPVKSQDQVWFNVPVTLINNSGTEVTQIAANTVTTISTDGYIKPNKTLTLPCKISGWRRKP